MATFTEEEMKRMKESLYVVVKNTKFSDSLKN